MPASRNVADAMYATSSSRGFPAPRLPSVPRLSEHLNPTSAPSPSPTSNPRPESMDSAMMDDLSPTQTPPQWGDDARGGQKHVDGLSRLVAELASRVQSPQADVKIESQQSMYGGYSLSPLPGWYSAHLAVPHRGDDEVSTAASTAHDASEAFGSYTLSAGPGSAMGDSFECAPTLPHTFAARSPIDSSMHSFPDAQQRSASFGTQASGGNAPDSGYQGSPEVPFEHSFANTISKLDEPVHLSQDRYRLQDHATQHCREAADGGYAPQMQSYSSMRPPGLMAPSDTMSVEAKEIIAKNILQPMMNDPRLSNVHHILRAELERLRSGAFSCLRDLDKHFSLMMPSQTDVRSYLLLNLTFLELCRTAVLEARLLGSADLYRPTDREQYDSDYFALAPGKLYGYARSVYNTPNTEQEQIISELQSMSEAAPRGNDPCSGTLAARALSNKRQSPHLNSTRRTKQTPAALSTKTSKSPAAKKTGRSAGSTTAQEDTPAMHALSPSGETNSLSPVASVPRSTSFGGASSPHMERYHDAAAFRATGMRSPTSSVCSYPGASPATAGLKSPRMKSPPKGPSASRRTSQGNFRCTESDCRRTFARACDLRKHNKTHVRPYKCSVPRCKYHELGFSAEKDRDRHFNDKHSATVKKHACKYQPCEYASPRESNVKQHMEKTHGYVYERSKWNPKSNPKKPKGAKPAEPSENASNTTFSRSEMLVPQPSYVNEHASPLLTPQSEYLSSFSQPNSAVSTVYDDFGTPETHPSYSPEATRLAFFPPLDPVPMSPAMHSPYASHHSSFSNSNGGYPGPPTLRSQSSSSSSATLDHQHGSISSQVSTSASPEIHISDYDQQHEGPSLFSGSGGVQHVKITPQYADEFLADFPVGQHVYLQRPPSPPPVKQPIINSDGLPIVQEQLYCHDDLDQEISGFPQ